MLSKIKFVIRGLLGFFENLEKNPVVCVSPIVIGKSAAGKDIACYKIGMGNKNVLILGSVHGNEVGTAKLVSNIINSLAISGSKGVVIYAVPVLNLDGHAKAVKNPDYFNGGAVGRTNSNNVDLNRNFDTKSWTKDGIWEFGHKKVAVSGGAKPLSEPETKALVKFVSDNKVEIIFDFHNRAGTVLATSDKLGKEIAEVYAKESGYKNITGSTWQNTGWIKDYFESKDITYIEIETTKRWGSDFDRNKQAILKSLKLISQSHT